MEWFESRLGIRQSNWHEGTKGSNSYFCEYSTQQTAEGYDLCFVMVLLKYSVFVF